MPGMDAHTFTTGQLAEFASKYGDVPLFIRSHGETYGIVGFGWSPDDGFITLSGGCPQDGPFAAFSIPDDPASTARLHHQAAEELARHMEEVAATIRARYPAAPAGG